MEESEKKKEKRKERKKERKEGRKEGRNKQTKTKNKKMSLIEQNRLGEEWTGGSRSRREKAHKEMRMEEESGEEKDDRSERDILKSKK